MSNRLIGSTTAVFTVMLSVAVDEIVDVNWTTRDGSAKAGVDYEASSGTVEFLPGETVKQIDVLVYGQDDLTAPDKNFFIALTPPSNAVLGMSLLECVIVTDNEDGVVVLSIVMPQGKRGLKGDPGLSAYEQAVLMGYEGSIEEWMQDEASASLAAERAQTSASSAASSAVVASQKAVEVATVGDAKLTEINEIAATVTVMADGKFYFKTEALLLAAKPESNIAAKALDTKKVWFWETTDSGVNGTWTDTGFSELDQAKEYSDQNKLDKSKISYIYTSGNMAGEKTKTLDNYGLDAQLLVVNQSAYSSKIIPVTPSDELYILNSASDYLSSTGHGYAFFADDPVLTQSPAIFGTRVEKVDSDSGLKYSAVTVPESAKYLMFNTRFNTQIIDWAIHVGSFSASYEQGIESVISINDAEIHKQLPDEVAKELSAGNSIEGDYFDKSKILSGYYLGADGTLQPHGPWSSYRFKVNDGETYFIKVIGSLSWTKKFVYSKSFDTVNNLLYVSDLNLVATDTPDVYKFTVPSGLDIKAVFLNIKIELGESVFDLTETLSIQKYTFDQDLIGISKKAISSIGNSSIVDEKARQMIAESVAGSENSRFKGKKFYCFGDSITEGTQGGYVSYIANKLQANVSNYGSSGAQTGRLVSIMTGQPNRQESGNFVTASDYTDVAGISIMIGTNHSWQTVSQLGSISDIPTSKVTDYTNDSEYWALFPNNFTANLALCIEYAKWKNKEMEIHLITPPYQVDAGEGAAHIAKLIPSLEAVAKFYGVHLIYGTYESGLAYKNLDSYTYDGTHLNTLGNKVFGRFVAQKILNL